MSTTNCGFDPDRIARVQPAVDVPDAIRGASARRNRILEQWQRERLRAARATYESGLRAQALDGKTLDDAALIQWLEAADQLGKIQISIDADARDLLRSKTTPTD